MNWAFVDYENVGSLESLTYSDYQRLYVFCGPKNTKLKFGVIPSDSFCSIELIGLTTTGHNNLDFHLSFYLGRFHEIAGENIAFHIISNDSGFDGLINHLKKIGRKCKRVSTKTKPQPHTNIWLGECAALVIEKLRKIDGRKRPRKRASFQNWIRSQCPNLSDIAAPEKVYEELVKANIVHETNGGITFNIDQ